MKIEIHIPRGTTYTITLALYNEDGTRYTKHTGDVLRLGIKRDREQDAYDIEKTGVYDNATGTWTFTILPADTMLLPFGRYEYDIGLQTAGNDYFMAVTASWFWIDTAITRAVIGS